MCSGVLEIAAISSIKGLFPGKVLFFNMLIDNNIHQ